MFSIWIKTLVIYLLISSLAINLAPSKEYKKQIGFFCGLIIVLIAIEPITYLFNINESDIITIKDKFDFSIYEKNTILNKETKHSYYSMSLEDSIMYELKRQGIEINDVKVMLDTNNEIIRCNIICKGKDYISDEEYENIKKIINYVYNIEYDNIYILKR